MNNIEEICCWEHCNEGSTHFSRIRLSRSDEKKKQIYSNLLLSADIFVKNLNYLKGLKISFLATVQASEMDAFSDYEVEGKMKEYIEKHFERENSL